MMQSGWAITCVIGRNAPRGEMRYAILHYCKTFFSLLETNHTLTQRLIFNPLFFAYVRLDPL